MKRVAMEPGGPPRRHLFKLLVWAATGATAVLAAAYVVARGGERREAENRKKRIDDLEREIASVEAGRTAEPG